MANFLTVEDLVQLAAGSCNRNFHRMLDTIRVLVARILDRVQPLDRLVAATVCCLLRKDFTVDAEPLKSLFHESSAEGLKWLWVLGATINKAASMASGDYLGVLDHDDELDTLTLFEYVKTINEHPDADCIYCDEDKINEQGKYCDPWFKSNWNPVLVIRVKIYGKEKVYEKTSCRDTNIL